MLGAQAARRRHEAAQNKHTTISQRFTWSDHPLTFSAPAETYIAYRHVRSAPSLGAEPQPRSLSAGELQPGRRSGAAHALAMDEGGAVLLVLGARHPELVLRAHAAQDGAAQPGAVLALALRVATEEHDAVRLAGDGG